MSLLQVVFHLTSKSLSRTLVTLWQKERTWHILALKASACAFHISFANKAVILLSLTWRQVSDIPFKGQATGTCIQYNLPHIPKLLLKLKYIFYNYASSAMASFP